MRIAMGADHAGFEMKNKIRRFLEQRGVQVADKGTNSAESVDYPDYACAVAEEVASGGADLGLLFCGSGIGMSIAANKVPSIRAAHATSEYEVEMSRAHNDANVLCLGGRTLDEETAEKFVDKFLATPFAGGRHQKRVDKISAMEREEAKAVEGR